MSRLQFVAVLVVLVGVLVLQAMPVLAPGRTSPTYEYLIKDINDIEFTDQMNKIGGGGWELVFARRAVGEGTPAYEVIFRRPT